MTNQEKFQAMCKNIARLRQQDRDSLKTLEIAQAEWKHVNAELTEANRVLDGFINNWRNEETKIENA